MNNTEYQIAGSAFQSCPIEMLYGLVYTVDDVLEIPKKSPFMQGWGIPETYSITDKRPNSFPLGLELCYLSIIERKFYEARIEFPDNLFELMWEPDMEYITFGMSPKGKIAIWISGENKSNLVCSIDAEETEVDMSLLSPFNPNITLQEYCNQYEPAIKGNESPDLEIFDSAIRQYNYKYLVLSHSFDKTRKDIDKDLIPIEFDWIEETLCDGTYDKLHDGNLNLYHLGGVPYKCNLKLHKGRTVWEVCFWMDCNALTKIFERFYGAHPETKADFIIRIDAENKKYELALYRQGLKEPVVIPESAYQMIVFKNKFEDYRSDNYNQPRGAWIW